MAAALFGAGRVVALDNDPDAVAVAKKNILQNNLTDRIEVSDTPLSRMRDSFDLICANIVHDVLVAMASNFGQLIIPGGYIVLAGILSGYQENNIIDIYTNYGLRPSAILEEGVWSAVLLQRSV
jgi:ribosomal protein L11 methyltransferase